MKGLFFGLTFALTGLLLVGCATTETKNKKPPPPPPPGADASSLPWSRMERSWETGIPGLSQQPQ